MERITYRKTLDVHKSGTQFLLQGFETADNMSRVIEISLMASGDAIDFPLERVVAMMYVTTPGATEPSINECTIKDNKVVYEVLPIAEEGITEMQIKLIETSPEGATSVLASPKFSVEVTKSGTNDGSAEKTTTFTALEEAMAKAKIAYDERFLRMELTSDCMFKAYYADGTLYETDLLKKLFNDGNALLSQSFAKGGTGVRADEDIDNSQYYSNVARSEALNAKDIMTGSEKILEEVKLHGVYTAFSVDFETGAVEYVSPSFKFNVNLETGDLDAEGQTYTFEDEIGRVVTEWLGERGVILSNLQEISNRHSEEIESLQETTSAHTEDIESLSTEITPIERGGTGATTKEDALVSLGVEPRLSDAENKLEWITLGTVSYSRSHEGDTTVRPIEETITIDCDNELLNQMTDFRYVLKKGAYFYTFASCSTSNKNVRATVHISSGGDNEICCQSVANGNNNESVENTITTDKDYILRCSVKTNDSRLEFEDNNAVYTIEASPNELTSLTCALDPTSNTWSPTTEYGNGKVECSFTIELQGKR